MHYKTLEEALRSVPNVQTQSYGLPAYNASKIRINGSDSVVVLVDGVRVSMTGTGQQYPFNLFNDMDNIKQIEVLKGAAAVMYGSDAKGGVINIITDKQPENKTKVSVSTGSFDTENYKISNEGTNGNTSWRVYGQKYITGDYEDGNGVHWDNHDNSESGGIMLNHKFSDKADIMFNYAHSKDEFDLFDHVSGDYKDGETKNQSMQLIYNQKFTDDFYNTFSYNKSRYYSKGDSTIAWNSWNNSYKTYLLNDTLTKKFGDTHTVALGAEFTKSENLEPVDSISNDQTVKNTSYFLQDEWKFDDKWKLTSGVRYDKPSINAGDVESNTSKSFTLGYTFNDNTNMYAAYNDYFVLPTMYQLYNSFYGNPNLSPEKGSNYEVGLNHRFDDATLLTVHYFNRDIDNAILWDNVNWKYVNGANNATAHGFDINLTKQFDDAWRANIGYTHLSDASETTGYLPSNLITMGVNYTKDKWDVGLDGRGFIGRNGQDVKSYGWPTDRYWVFNLGINYKPEDDLKVFAKLNNIFDQEYAEATNVFYGNPGDWYGMPGRNLTVGMEMEF